MPQTRRQAIEAEGRFRLSCSLGLDSQILMPALVKSLREIVPNLGCTLVWCNEYLEPTNMYSEPQDPKLSALYYTEFHNSREREVVVTIDEGLRLPGLVRRSHEILKVSWHEFLRSDFYNIFWRQGNFRHVLGLKITDGGELRGSVTVLRTIRHGDFSAAEVRALKALLPHLGHAMATSNAYAGPWVDSEDVGLIILDSLGRIQHMSPAARTLVTHAAHPVISYSAYRHIPALGDVEVLLRRLCHDLGAIARGQGTPAPPVARIQNSWGRFTFRACWLEAVGTEGTTLIGVSVQRQEPLTLRLTRAISGFPLSPRERQICLQMAHGLSYAEIARRLERSERTVVTHTQHIFEKLEINSRRELFDRLMLM
ncbi:MAG: response regulator transcription factor [Gammaproteobacteria bacterium]